MERRGFIASAVGLGLGTRSSDAAPPPHRSRELYELRRYRLRVGHGQAQVDSYMQEALLPALRRLGLGPIGAFGVALGADSPSLLLLIPHPTAHSFSTLGLRLDEDAVYTATASDFLDASPTEPLYERFETSLLVAFASHPRLSVPDAATENRPRIFELRSYESHSERASRRKTEMFGPGGEIAIFRKTGLTPVFFGETLAGARMPSLSYMLVFDDMSAREAAWGRFREHPEWRALSSTPGLSNSQIVSRIQSEILRPMPYSQI